MAIIRVSKLFSLAILSAKKPTIGTAPQIDPPKPEMRAEAKKNPNGNQNKWSLKA